MTTNADALNRWFVGIVAAACFAAAAVVAVIAPGEAFWWGSLLRAGVVVTALWYCLPTKDRPAAWAGISPLMATLMIAAFFLTLLRPKVGLPFLLVLLGVRYVFRPRRPRGPR